MLIKEFASASEACKELGVSRGTLEKLAQAAEAKIKKDKFVRYDMPKLYGYLRKDCAVCRDGS